MFNYYACRKIAADELSRSINDLTECKKLQKQKQTRDSMAKRYKLRVVGFVKDQLVSNEPQQIEDKYSLEQFTRQAQIGKPVVETRSRLDYGSKLSQARNLATKSYNVSRMSTNMSNKQPQLQPMESRGSDGRSSLNLLHSRYNASSRTSEAQETFLTSTSQTPSVAGRSIRMADSTQERIQKRVSDNKFLDTTPNADINVTWAKQCRKRNLELEVGPTFRYSCRNTVERLHDKFLQDPVSSEVVMMERKSLHKLTKFTQNASSMRRLQNIGSTHACFFDSRDKTPRGGMRRAAGGRSTTFGMKRPAHLQGGAGSMNARSSLPLMKTRSKQGYVFQDDSDTESQKRKTRKQKLQELQAVEWKRFRPDLNRKNFFKGAASITVGIESSLNLKDEVAREVVKGAFEAAGQPAPQQSFFDRQRELQHEVLSSSSDSSSEVRDKIGDAKPSVNSRAQMLDKSLDKNSTLMKVMSTKTQLDRLNDLRSPRNGGGLRTENSLFSVDDHMMDSPPYETSTGNQSNQKDSPTRMSPSKRSLAMLNLIDGLRLKDKPLKEKGKKHRGEEDHAIYDGLVVDYSKFSELTKSMLRDANVLRQKSVKVTPPHIFIQPSSVTNSNTKEGSSRLFSPSDMSMPPSTPVVNSFQNTGNIRSMMQTHASGIQKQRPAVTFSNQVN